MELDACARQEWGVKGGVADCRGQRRASGGGAGQVSSRSPGSPGLLKHGRIVS